MFIELEALLVTPFAWIPTVFGRLPTTSALVLLVALVSQPVSSAAAPSDVSEEELQFILGEIAGNYEKIAKTIGDRELAELAGFLRESASLSALRVLASGQTGRDIRRGLREQLDATAVLAEALPKILRQDEAETAANCGDADPSACRAISWPVATCDIPDPPNFGNPGAAGWTALVAAVGVLDGAVAAAASARAPCEGIWATAIKSDPVILSGECLDEYVSGQALFEIDDPGFNSWNVDGVSNNPAACTALDTSVAAARKAVALLRSVLDCWDYGEVKASYERLAVIHEELTEIIDAEVLIEQLLIERMLHHSSGSRPAVGYLPSSNGGDLELARQFTEEAINNTAAAGFVLSRKAQAYLTLGNDAFLAGQFKASFDFYRRAYRAATSASRRYRPEG